MTRTRVRHRCQGCAATAPRWLGRCPECGAWGTLEEEVVAVRAGGAGAGGTVARLPLPPTDVTPVPLAAVDPIGAAARPTGVGELDRVLGGGLVAGSVTLLGGEPGMGKSTLVLQALAATAAAGARGLLVTGEESAAQVRLRAGRLGALGDGVLVVGETSLPHLLAHVEATDPQVLVVDSVQTLHDPDAPGSPGSVGQVRECAQRLVRLAKERQTSVVLVGHVTKDGALAGPRVLEHVVDTVLELEGDRHHALRMIRATKHRFGSTDEVGIVEMTAGGLVDVTDPSALFLADRRSGAAGSVVAPVLDGTRPLLVEVQALVASTSAPVPRRAAQSLDRGRLAMLVAVLGRRTDLSLGAADVWASVAGGVRVVEPGADLAVALAIVGASTGVPLPDGVVVLGEVGLGGEVRGVARSDRRLREAARLGFTAAVVPVTTPDVPGLVLHRAGDLDDACGVLGLAI